MLKTLLDVTIPILVFLLMLVVGTELVPDDLRRAARQFRTVAIATVAQIILWPLVAVSVILTLRLKPYIATGILLVAVCPCGGMANFYVYLGRANLPLSVTLTAVSCLSAVVTMPLLMALLRTHLVEFSGLETPISLMIGQLLLLLILPILLGMLARRVRPSFTKRHGRTILRLGIAALAGLIAIVIAQEYEQLVVDFTDISLAVAVLSVIMLAAAWVVGWAGNFGAWDRFTLAMVLVVRNVGIATAVAVTVLGRIEFAAFATAYFVNQVPIICAALILFRLRRPSIQVCEGGAREHEPASQSSLGFESRPESE
jgi:bile acid:Na+ symporter, BASS family